MGDTLRKTTDEVEELRLQLVQAEAGAAPLTQANQEAMLKWEAVELQCQKAASEVDTKTQELDALEFQLQKVEVDGALATRFERCPSIECQSNEEVLLEEILEELLGAAGELSPATGLVGGSQGHTSQNERIDCVTKPRMGDGTWCAVDEAKSPQPSELVPISPSGCLPRAEEVSTHSDTAGFQSGLDMALGEAVGASSQAQLESVAPPPYQVDRVVVHDRVGVVRKKMFLKDALTRRDVRQFELKVLDVSLRMRVDSLRERVLLARADI